MLSHACLGLLSFCIKSLKILSCSSFTVHLAKMLQQKTDNNFQLCYPAFLTYSTNVRSKKQRIPQQLLKLMEGSC